VKIEDGERVIADHAPREPFAELRFRHKRSDVVVHPLGAEMHQHRATELFEFAHPHHRAEHRDRVFIRHFDHLGLFFEQNFADQRIVLHILPRLNQTITLVENGRELRRDVVDSREFVDLLDVFLFAGNDQANLPPVTRGGGEQVIKTRADAARVFMIIVGDVN